jgi:N-acetylmuramoyl-L-alanine amidase
VTFKAHPAGRPFSPDSQQVSDVIPSPNVNERRGGLGPELLVLHYTGLPTFGRSIEVLRDPRCEVSCHYVVDLDGQVVQMVPESLRAWHAGASSWCGVRDLNSQSIGIEIQNPGHCGGYPDFPPAQMTAVRALAADIVARHGIKPRNVVAHSDIAPGRKIDPGEKFDWPGLSRAGIGHWVVPSPVAIEDEGLGPGASGDAVEVVQDALRTYGYGIEANGVFDAWTQTVVSAFQRHFRPERVDGRIDSSTVDTLDRLLKAIG